MRAGILLIFLIYHCSTWASEASAVDPKLRSALKTAIAEGGSFKDRFHAEVWLMDMSTRLQRFVPEHEQRLELLRLVHMEATRADLKPEWVLAVIEVESAFDRFAISRSGALGLMQIMPFWLDELDMPGANLFHTPLNIRFGCTILAHYLKREKGNLERALARYNGSLGSQKYPNKVFKALRKRWYTQ